MQRSVETGKRSFVMYNDQCEVLNNLTDEQAGKIIKAIAIYNSKGEEPDLDPLMMAIFQLFRAAIDRDLEKYRAKCRKNAENGRKGGKQRQANASERVANQADSGSDSESVSESESEKPKHAEAEKSTDEKQRPKAIAPTWTEKKRAALDLWLQYKKEKRQSYKPTGLSAFVKKHDAWTDARFAAAVEYSMANNWDGLYEEKKEKAQKKPGFDLIM